MIRSLAAKTREKTGVNHINLSSIRDLSLKSPALEIEGRTRVLLKMGGESKSLFNIPGQE